MIISECRCCRRVFPVRSVVDAAAVFFSEVVLERVFFPGNAAADVVERLYLRRATCFGN